MLVFEWKRNVELIQYTIIKSNKTVHAFNLLNVDNCFLILLSNRLIILGTFFVHSIVNDSSIFRCFGIGIAVRSRGSVVAIVSAVEVVVIIVSPVVGVLVSGIELHLHVDSLPPARVGGVAAVAPGGCAAVGARVISAIIISDSEDGAIIPETPHCRSVAKMTQGIPPVVVVVAPAPVHPLPHHVGDELAAPGKLAAQLRVATIAQNPE